jgi:hypothetical protein
MGLPTAMDVFIYMMVAFNSGWRYNVFVNG